MNLARPILFASNYHWVRVKKLQKEFAIGVSVRLILGVALFFHAWINKKVKDLATEASVREQYSE